MTGDSCLARAVAPRAAAAVDHADTELIGHRGWEGTGFLCGEKKGEEEIIDILSPSFLVLQKDNTKTRIQIRARQYCGPLRIRRQR
jgi:hypothetical protein